jgi:hypothetical protein
MAMKLKRKASVIAVALALSSPAVWAGVSSGAAEANEAQNPGTQAAEQAAGTQSAIDGAKESLGWTYVNGQAAGEQAQAADSPPDQPAMTQPDDDGRTVATQQDGAATGDQAAASSEEDDQAAQSEPEADEQTAKSEEDDGQDQAAAGEDQSSNERSAQSEEGSSGNDQAADSGAPAGLEGKVIVIIPRDWQGSLKDLVAALEASPDAKDIVIVQQGDPQAGNDSEDYFAEKPVRNEGTQ